MNDEEGRLGDEIAPSRDPDASRPMPRVEQGAGDERRDREAGGTAFEPFLDNAMQNADHPARASGPSSGDEAASAGQDTASETMLEEPGLAPRGGGSPDDTAEGA